MSASRPITERPWRLFALVGGATLVTSINYSLIFVAFGGMRETFSGEAAVVPWALTGYSITTAALLVPAGWMADRFGRERIFVVGLALFGTGSLVVAASPTAYVLVLGRVIQACGLVAQTASALPILLDAFPRGQRAMVVGGLGAAGGAAATIGPVIGGALVDTIGWRGTFAVNAPIGFALCALVFLRLPRTRPSAATGPPDLVGVAAMAAGMGLVVLAVTETGTWGVADARTLAAALAGLVLLALVVARSRRHPDPVLHLPLFGDASYRRGVLLNVLIGGSFSGTFFSMIRLLTEGWGLSTFHAGVAVAVIPLFAGPLSLLAGRIADRHGPRVVIVPGALVIAVAGFAFSAAVTPEPAVATVFLPLASLYGIGVGFAHAACQGAALRTVEPARLGIGGAMSRIGLDLGGVVTVAIAVAVVTSSGDAVVGAQRVTLLVSVICAVGALLALRLPPTPRPAAEPLPAALTAEAGLPG